MWTLLQHFETQRLNRILNLKDIIRKIQQSGTYQETWKKILDSKKQDDTWLKTKKIRLKRTTKNFKMNIQEFQDEDSRILKETRNKMDFEIDKEN